jgi:hypothetical protein
MHADALAATFAKHTAIAQLNRESVDLALELNHTEDTCIRAIALAGAIAQLAWLAIDLQQAHKRLAVAA